MRLGKLLSVGEAAEDVEAAAQEPAGQTAPPVPAGAPTPDGQHEVPAAAQAGR
jgi:hypothetical protein